MHIVEHLKLASSTLFLPNFISRAFPPSILLFPTFFGRALFSGTLFWNGGNTRNIASSFTRSCSLIRPSISFHCASFSSCFVVGPSGRRHSMPYPQWSFPYQLRLFFGVWQHLVSPHPLQSFLPKSFPVITIILCISGNIPVFCGQRTSWCDQPSLSSDCSFSLR